MDFFISDAMAQAAPAGQQGSPFGTLIFFGLLFGLMYFLLIRPQNKRAKELREMQASLSAGDEIATNGGIVGKITKVDEQYVTVEVADGTSLVFQKHAIVSMLPKGTLKSL